MSADKKNKYIFILIIVLGILFICVLIITKFNVFDKVDVNNFDDTLSAEEFYIMTNQPNVEILDLRTPAEYNNGHIAGVTNINFYDTLKRNTEIDKLDKNKTYLVYCQTDKRSGKTMGMMKEKGFPNVYLLKGGFNAWKLDGKPVIKDSVK